MAHPDHVPLESLISCRAVPGGVVVGESWPGCVVPGLDGFEPGVADGKACGRVEVPHKGFHAREVVCAERS